MVDNDAFFKGLPYVEGHKPSKRKVAFVLFVLVILLVTMAVAGYVLAY